MNHSNMSRRFGPQIACRTYMLHFFSTAAVAPRRRADFQLSNMTCGADFGRTRFGDLRP